MAETIGHIAPMPAPVRPDVRQQTATPAEPPQREVAPAQNANGRKLSDEAPTGQYTKLDNTKLTVSLDSETGTYVYKSVSAEDGEVVWQWPSEQVMRVIQYFRRIESLDEKLASKRSIDQKA